MIKEVEAKEIAKGKAFAGSNSLRGIVEGEEGIETLDFYINMDNVEEANYLEGDKEVDMLLLSLTEKYAIYKVKNFYLKVEICFEGEVDWWLYE